MERKPQREGGSLDLAGLGSGGLLLGDGEEGGSKPRVIRARKEVTAGVVMRTISSPEAQR